MKTVLACSLGKDSIASGIVSKLNGDRIDKIITVQPDPFKGELEIARDFEDFMGIKIEFIECPSFEDYFFTKKVRGNYKGTIYGWPFTAYKACARVMKWDPMAKWQRKQSGKDIQWIVGIGSDETQRKLHKDARSVLIENNITTSEARKICEEHGLLNPLYGHFKRTGCVRCPKQGRAALEKVRELEPEKFKWMWDNDSLSPVGFKPTKNGSISFRDYIRLPIPMTFWEI